MSKFFISGCIYIIIINYIESKPLRKYNNEYSVPKENSSGNQIDNFTSNGQNIPVIITLNFIDADLKNMPFIKKKYLKKNKMKSKLIGNSNSTSEELSENEMEELTDYNPNDNKIVSTESAESSDDTDDSVSDEEISLPADQEDANGKILQQNKESPFKKLHLKSSASSTEHWPSQRDEDSALIGFLEMSFFLINVLLILFILTLCAFLLIKKYLNSRCKPEKPKGIICCLMPITEDDLKKKKCVGELN